MSNLYVACELGADKGRIFLGALEREGLTVSEAGEFQDLTTHQEGVAQWDVTKIYQQVSAAVHTIVAHEEPVRGISFHSSVTEALLFESNGSLLTPANRPTEAAATAEFNKLLSKVPREALYEETGLQPLPAGMLCQLAAEPSRRLKRAGHAMPLADGFNYVFSGVPRVEVSQAIQSQLYNSVAKSWSERLLKASGVPARLMPPVVQAGSVLGAVRPDIAPQVGLEDARVVATCSHELAASLAALTVADPDNWAFLVPGDATILGTRLDTPFINDISREMSYSNLIGYGDSVGFYKSWVGLSLVEECRRAWVLKDRAMDSEVLIHLATSSPPLDAFIDPADPRFATADDLPLSIQGFCRETGQEAPRKPGSIVRCILESLALQYRKGLLELEYLTSSRISRLYVLGGRSNILLNHFLANALQVPVVVVPPEAAGLGNVMAQAMALGHITSLEQARELVGQALKTQTIQPHGMAWNEAYDRFLALSPS